MLQPRFAWRTPAHQADVRFLQILCFALYYRSLWASYESLRTYHKNDSASCFFFAVEGVPFPSHHENNSLSCYFFMLLGTFVTVLHHALRGEPRHTRTMFAFAFKIRSYSQLCLFQKQVAKRAGRCYNRIYIIILKGFFILCHKTLSINFASADL